MSDLPAITDQQYWEYKSAIERAGRMDQSERRERLGRIIDDLRYNFRDTRDREKLIDYARSEY